ncbi:hypothetical protein BC629DRAFT_1254779, partial [Irpex lacteus]
KLLSITTDSASSNDTFVDEMGDLVPTFPGSAAHNRCMGHVVNLTGKSLLRPFD